MSRRRPGTLRIGELAARTGLSAPTLRYYEQIGLVPSDSRPRRSHRLYTENDVERLAFVRRLRDLLGLSLDELEQIVSGGAWLVPERPWLNSESMIDRMGIVDEAVRQLDRQIALVRARAEAIVSLERELVARRFAIESKRLSGP